MTTCLNSESSHIVGKLPKFLLYLKLANLIN